MKTCRTAGIDAGLCPGGQTLRLADEDMQALTNNLNHCVLVFHTDHNKLHFFSDIALAS